MKSIFKRILAIGASFIMVAGIAVESASPAFAYGAAVGTVGNGYARIIMNQTTIAAVTVCHSNFGTSTAASAVQGKIIIGSFWAAGPVLGVITTEESKVSGAASGVHQNGSWFCNNLSR